MQESGDARGGYPFFALRRPAQYFFMRSDTARRMAGDLVKGLRDLAGLGAAAGRAPENSSGNA